MIILLEGLDNTGKSTVSGIIEGHFQHQDVPVMCLRAPGSTAIAERIRDILKSKELREAEKMGATSQTLLFLAAITQTIDHIETVKSEVPDTVFILDRWIISTYIYQCLTGNFPYPYLYQLFQMIGINKVIPDVVVLLENTSHVVKQPDDAIEQEFIAKRSLMQNHYRNVMRPENFNSIFPFYKDIPNRNRLVFDIAGTEPADTFNVIMDLPALRGK